MWGTVYRLRWPQYLSKAKLPIPNEGKAKSDSGGS